MPVFHWNRLEELITETKIIDWYQKCKPIIRILFIRTLLLGTSICLLLNNHSKYQFGMISFFVFTADTFHFFCFVVHQ